MSMPRAEFLTARPDELEAVVAEVPVAYLPLGTYGHHGWHLPPTYDGIKAYELCRRSAERTGGVVFPTLYYGIGGGHVGYKWTAIVDEVLVRPLLEVTLDRLVAWGFQVIVLYTGHYAGEQVRMVHALAEEAEARHPQARFWGVTDPELTSPLPGDTRRGDHAAKYETSIALYLNPEWVRLDLLTAGRRAEDVALPETPRGEGTPYQPAHRLYAIHGDDPAEYASAENGELIVDEILDLLATGVWDRQAELRDAARAAAGEPQDPEADVY